ncbi:unnamed protein product [Moneuplotes crassus]|uniref:Steroid 5-alpha reductase C-terminal domain-containing protein n=1 Tax=Euplotes crassus TaxID=5936 RepID=A0AAD2D0B8_EUPCR|nr:unnamed protein product [Moneuplotes crassus]
MEGKKKSSESTYPCSSLMEGLSKFSDFATARIPPGPQFIPFNWAINSLKGLTGVYLFLIMLYHDNFSLGAWVYFTVHGSYGMFWILKDQIFPDSKFGVKITLMSCTLPYIVMYIYLLPGYRMLSTHSGNDPSIGRIIACYVSYVLGIFLMIGSDLQKHFSIKYNPGLINTGFFKMTRNPNYLGEILIYNSFAIIVARMEFWTILFYAYTIIFGIRMLVKDYSLSRKVGWKEYDSYLLLPKFSTSTVDNIVIYMFIAFGIFSMYITGGILPFLKELKSILIYQDSEHFCSLVRSSDAYGYLTNYISTYVSLIK